VVTEIDSLAGTTAEQSPPPIRRSSRPDNPGLIAGWPGIRQDRMAAACAELRRRGDPARFDGEHPPRRTLTVSSSPERASEAATCADVD
jgi:hypothetical protein